MGLLQKAMETYDAMQSLVGVYEEGKEPLAPIGHIVTKAQIEITIDPQGRFVEAKTADKDKKIIIPVTEESSGRTSSPAAHALCDQIGYLSGKDRDKFTLYTERLEKWVLSEYSHPKAEAVLRYVKAGTMTADLEKSGISAQNEKDMVCWRVNGLGVDNDPPVWTDKALMKAYSDFYTTQKSGGRNLCMLTGEDTFITWQHLKGVFSLNGNAKIISANDSANFTYRGRFAEPEEAASMGYIASQKAHNALKWLIGTQGTVLGGRAFVCWNPKGQSIPRPQDALLFASTEPPAADYKSYREALRKKLLGYQGMLETDARVIAASFDAATTGRLAITYYNELMGSDFLERLAYWDETCCWAYSSKSVSSPSLYSVINFAFGTPSGKPQKVAADDKIVAGHMQRLLSSRIDRAAFPADIMRALFMRAGNLQVYEKENRTKLLFIACAAIRKYYIDHKKEAFELALEPERKDRSYQWGRLLAVMEKAERDTYEPTEDSKRETNAIRMQSVFVQRPGYAAKIIMDQLKNAYYPKLRMGQRIYYDRLIGEIMEQLSAFSAEEYGKPLTETYLPGYYLQKNAFYTKHETEDESDEV